MKWTPLLVTVAAAATAGCDSIPFLGDRGADTTAAAVDTAATTPAADTGTTPAAEPGTTATRPAPPGRPTVQPARQTTPLVDEPWTPTASGTVRPGMSRDEVVATWGTPVAERSAAGWSYLYYRNGCEVTCGTFDVVFLEDGQVVDAIVRWSGHTYDGVSSSPPDRPAAATPPGGSST